MRRLREENPEKYRLLRWTNGLAQKYQVTPEWFTGQIEAQGGKCPTCSVPYDMVTPKGAHQPCVDHCHETGKVRGVVCRLCNLALGGARDSESTLLNLAEYLRKSRQEG